MSNHQYSYEDDSNLLFISNKYTIQTDDSQDIFAIDIDVEMMFSDEPNGLTSGSFDQFIVV
jgi:hypothetical protein